MSRVAGVTAARSAVDVERPAVGLAQLVEGHVGAGRRGRPRTGSGSPARSRSRGRPARAATLARQKIASSAPAKTRTSSGSRPSYSAGDLATQQRVAGRLGVAEGQAVPQRAGLGVGQGEQLGHRIALDVRRAQQVLDVELPAREVALQGEVGRSHGRMMPGTMLGSAAMSRTIVLAGSPTALGGHFAGMERTPAELRRLGLAERLAADPAFEDVAWHDAGDAAERSGLASPDPDPRAKNRAAIIDYLPRLATHVAVGLAAAGDPDARLLVLGGDCTSQVGAAGRAAPRATGHAARPRLVRRPRRLQHAGHDAVRATSGACPSRCSAAAATPDLVAAGDGPSVRGGGCRADRRSGPRRDRVADAGGQPDRPVRGGHDRRPTPGGPPWRRGARRSPRASTAGTSPSTWTPSTRPRTSPWPCPSRTGSRSTTRSRAVAIIAASGPVLGFGATAAQFGGGGRSDADGRRDRGAWPSAALGTR